MTYSHGFAAVSASNERWWLKITARLVAFLLLTTIAAAQATTINICSQSASTYNILGTNAASLRSKLTNTANFGPTGPFGDFQFTFQTFGSPTLPNLLSTCQIWFSGYEPDSAYTAAEITAIQNYAAAGGAIIAGCDGSNNDPVCDGLGATVVTDTDSYSEVTVPGSEVSCTADGLEVGDVIEMAGGVGGYFSTTPAGSVTVLTVHETGGLPDFTKPTTFVVEPPSGVGMYGLITDINMIQTPTLSAGTGIVNANDRYAMDLLALAARVSQGGSTTGCSIGTDATLSLLKESSVDPIVDGVPFTYTITVNNIGFNDASNVVISDVLDSSLNCNSVTASGTGTASACGGTVTCTWASISTAGSETCTIDVTP